MLYAPAINCEFRRASHSQASKPSGAAAVIAETLAASDDQLDYASAKIKFDSLIDSEFDADAVQAQLDRLTEAAWELTNGSRRSEVRLGAVRRLLYESGPWNDHRPFGYDHIGFKDIQSKLLAAYLACRLGNCVSMPILFLIVAERLGLNVALARAPIHLFVRHHCEDGRITNLETTSGALPARDIWIQETRGVTQRGIETGFYMRSLSRREAIGAMALSVIEHFMDGGRYQEAIDVAEILSQNDPTDGLSLAHQGQAYFRIIGRDFPDFGRSHWNMPESQRLRYSSLLERNHKAFRAAHALGWEPKD